MFYIKVSTILLVLALVALAVFACVMMAAWWSRKEEQEDPCIFCPMKMTWACWDCPDRKDK